MGEWRVLAYLCIGGISYGAAVPVARKDIEGLSLAVGFAFVYGLLYCWLELLDKFVKSKENALADNDAVACIRALKDLQEYDDDD